MRRLLELLIILDRHTEFVLYAEEAEAAARAAGLHTVHSATATCSPTTTEGLWGRLSSLPGRSGGPASYLTK